MATYAAQSGVTSKVKLKLLESHVLLVTPKFRGLMLLFEYSIFCGKIIKSSQTHEIFRDSTKKWIRRNKPLL